MPSKRQGTSLQASVSDCRHHWEIEYSQETESRGRCRLCGEQRVFVNKMSSPRKRTPIVVEGINLDEILSPDEDSPKEA